MCVIGFETGPGWFSTDLLRRQIFLEINGCIQELFIQSRVARHWLSIVRSADGRFQRVRCTLRRYLAGRSTSLGDGAILMTGVAGFPGSHERAKLEIGHIRPIRRMALMVRVVRR